MLDSPYRRVRAIAATLGFLAGTGLCLGLTKVIGG
jgi:hypothetical protein